MSPGHFTNMATLICGPAGLLVRYEWSGRLLPLEFLPGRPAGQEHQESGGRNPSR